MESNRKSEVMIGVISSIVLVVILGVTYAIWNYSEIADNQILVSGDIFMKYTESNQLTIENAFPKSEPEDEDYFEFTIEGKNTYTKPIWYEIIISHGEEHETRKSRISDEFLRFRLTEQLLGEEENVVIKEGKYSDFANGKRIWVNTIASNQRNKIKITYKLYMWISDKMNIGAGDSATLSDMDIDTWNNDAYASVKVIVKGDFQEKQLPNILGTEVLKEKVGKEGELIAITEDNKSTTDINGSDIREYRYSGTNANNYVYFNCKDNREPNKNNCEVWRIVGVFKNEEGNELIKIVRTNNISHVPEKYKVGDDWYDLKLSA